MQTYIALLDFTDQGVRAIDESPRRADAAIKQATADGLVVKDIYWTTGSHDGLIIVEARDEQTAAAFFLTLVRMGNVRTTTLSAFDRAEFEEVVARIH